MNAESTDVRREILQILRSHEVRQFLLPISIEVQILDHFSPVQHQGGKRITPAPRAGAAGVLVEVVQRPRLDGILPAEFLIGGLQQRVIVGGFDNVRGIVVDEIDNEGIAGRFVRSVWLFGIVRRLLEHQ